MKWTPIVAIICITVLEAIALLMGVNGVLFSLAIAALSGLGGYQIKSMVNNKRGVK